MNATTLKVRRVGVLSFTHLLIAVCGAWSAIAWLRTHADTQAARALIHDEAEAFCSAYGVLRHHKRGKQPWTPEQHLAVWRQVYGSLLVDYAMATLFLDSRGETLDHTGSSAASAAKDAVANDILSLFPEPKPGITSLELRLNHRLNPEHLTNREILQKFIDKFYEPDEMRSPPWKSGESNRSSTEQSDAKSEKS